MLAADGNIQILLIKRGGSEPLLGVTDFDITEVEVDPGDYLRLLGL
jgi:hypothetical protein